MNGIKEWLDWANTYKNVRVVVENIPNGILPDGYIGRLHDVKVVERMDDDYLYENDPLLRDGVARGNCVLELQKGDIVTYLFIVRGLKKFTDVLGKLFIRPMSEAKTIISIRKFNGEAAHLGVCKIEGHYYMCGGSKNVHMLFRNEQDLEKYDLKSLRFTFAYEICKKIISLRLDAKLLDFIMFNNVTVIFEYLNSDHQHVERIYGNSLKFITWTSCDLNCDSMCRFSPDSGIDIAKFFGLDTAEYEIISIKNLASHINMVRASHGTEGVVLYFIDGKSTIGLNKIKSIWYIILRSIREKLRTALKRKWNVDKFEREMKRRIHELQDWLEFEDETKTNWFSLSVDFYSWCLNRMIDMNVFPILWNQFLKETDKDDDLLI